jgi:NAD(P)-dependent dehydrogenase (short-subunit alcohol dehydrogenase family)
VCADVTDAAAVDAVVRDVASRFGRIDLVLHGAGTQLSKALSKKKLEEFRGIVATKVAGLGNLHHACRAHLPQRAVSFHLLSSAFSYFGNDGQPDYGAANEAMNRIAASAELAPDDGHWTALGWLGWAGIGMTRGSEYAALARARGLRPVTREEGQAIFSRLLAGEPVSPVNILISAGEANFFGLQVDDDPGRVPSLASPERSRSPRVATETIELHWDLSLRRHPYLGDHLVRGRPVLPASFEAELAARAARALRAGHQAIALEGARLESFVRIPATGAIRLRGRASVMEETADDTLVLVQLLSDFVHKSGRVLRRDILHFETRVRLTNVARELDPMNGRAPKRSVHPVTVPDPYLSPQAPVKLSGIFRCLDAIEIGDGVRHARFRIGEDEKLHLLSDFVTPAVLGDGLFRFSMIQPPAGGSIPIHIPVHCGRILMAPGINDALLHSKGENLLLAAAVPRPVNELIHSDWAQVTDRSGRVLMTAEALVAQRFGEVPDGT